MRIKNWKQFQHYTRRNPPWIRLYRTLLDDREWFALDGDAGKMLIMCWLVASDDDGNLPSAADLAFRFRMTEKQVNAALSKLSHWLEHDASTTLADCSHDATPEQSRAEQSRAEQRQIQSRESAALTRRLATFGAICSARGSLRSLRSPVRPQIPVDRWSASG